MGVAVRGLAGRSYVDKVDGVGLKILQAQQASRYRAHAMHTPYAHAMPRTCT